MINQVGKLALTWTYRQNENLDIKFSAHDAFLE